MRQPTRRQISIRYRRVSWGRLYWKYANTRNSRFESDDVAIVRNGTLTTHYKTIDALMHDIEWAEEAQRDQTDLDYHMEGLQDNASY